MKINDTLVTLRSISALNSTLLMKNSRRSVSRSITRVVSHLHASAFQGTEGALGPVGIIGPSGHPVRTSSLILCARLYVTSLCSVAVMEWCSVSFLSIRDPRVTKGVGGRRCVAPVLMNPSQCVLWAQSRILSMEPARRSASFAPQHFSFPIVLGCLLFHSQWHLAAVGSWQGDKCWLISSFLRALLSARSQARSQKFMWVEIRFLRAERGQR